MTPKQRNCLVIASALLAFNAESPAQEVTANDPEALSLFREVGQRLLQSCNGLAYAYRYQSTSDRDIFMRSMAKNGTLKDFFADKPLQTGTWHEDFRIAGYCGSEGIMSAVEGKATHNGYYPDKIRSNRYWWDGEVQRLQQIQPGTFEQQNGGDLATQSLQKERIITATYSQDSMLDLIYSAYYHMISPKKGGFGESYGVFAEDLLELTGFRLSREADVVIVEGNVEKTRVRIDLDSSTLKPISSSSRRISEKYYDLTLKILSDFNELGLPMRAEFQRYFIEDGKEILLTTRIHEFEVVRKTTVKPFENPDAALSRLSYQRVVDGAFP